MWEGSLESNGEEGGHKTLGRCGKVGVEGEGGGVTRC